MFRSETREYTKDSRFWNKYSKSAINTFVLRLNDVENFLSQFADLQGTPAFHK